MGRLLFGVWGQRAIKIPNCIALEYVKNIVEGMAIRGRFIRRRRRFADRQPPY